MSGSGEQKKATRYCDRSGRWEEGDYSNCHYTNDITRVLHTFILVSACSQILTLTNAFNNHMFVHYMCIRFTAIVHLNYILPVILKALS